MLIQSCPIKALHFVAPIPPSINMAYITDWRTKRRHLSKKAAYYKKELSAILTKLRFETFKSDIELAFHFAFKDKKRRDLSNYIKILEDCLVENSVLIDDSKVEILLVSRLKADKENPHVEIVIAGRTEGNIP